MNKILSIQISKRKKKKKKKKRKKKNVTNTIYNKIICCSVFQMSIDPSEIVQAGSTVYEASPGSIPTTYIPTTSAGG